MSGEETKGTIRPATVADGPAVNAFLRGLGLVLPDDPDDVARHWRGVWADNPALARHAPDVALGWVLEDAGAIRGVFCNLPLMAYMGETPIRISCGRAWAVEKAYRSETRRLCEAYFGQPNLDVVLISTAIPATGRRCLEFGGVALPQPEHGTVLYWVVNSPAFLRAAFRKKGRGRQAAFWLGLLASVPFDFVMRLSGRRPYASLAGVTPVPVSAIDADFDALYTAKRTELPDALLACRDAETLRWYFGLGARADETRVLRCDRDGGLKGYVVLIRDDAPAIGLKRYKIADMLVREDDPAVVDSLLAAAYEYATAKGVHVVELIGLPPHLRARAGKHKPYSRPLPTFPFYYKAQTPDLAARLADGASWYVTAYDGDSALL